MPALFDYFNRSNGSCAIEDENLPARQNERRPQASYCQRETIHRPNRIMIVVIITIGSQELSTTEFGCHVADMVEMGVHDRWMIMTGSGSRVNVLKRSYKKCQHECQTSL